MKIKKEVIQLDNLLGCSGRANYIYQCLLEMEDVLSVRVNIDQGDVEIYYKDEVQRADFIHVLTKAGYPEAGTSTSIHRVKARFNGLVGVFI